MLSFLSHHKCTIWILFTLALLISAMGLFQLKITPDNRVFYGENDERFNQLQFFESEFVSNSTIAYVLTCDTPISTCREMAEVTRSLTTQALQIAGVIKVDSLATYPYLISDATTMSSKPYLDVICPLECDLSNIKTEKMEHLIGRFTNRDFSTFAVVATIDLDMRDVGAVGRMYGNASKLIEDVPDAIDARFVGTVPMMNAFVGATQNELTGVISIAATLLLITLILTLGNYWIVAIATGLGAATVAITLGIAGWLDIKLNTATATIPLVLFTLTTATSMHLFMSIVRMTSDDIKMPVPRAVSASLSAQWRPILLTAITTFVCMLSLMSVQSPPVQEIGYLTALGVVIGTSLLLTVIPLTIAQLSSISPSRWYMTIQPFLNRYARKIERRKLAVFLIGLATISASLSVLDIEIDDDFVRYFDADNEFRIDSEYVSEKLFGPNNVEIVLDSGASDGIFDSDYVASLSELTENLRSLQSISNVYSLVDVLEPFNVALDDSRDLTSLSEDELSQLFLGYELSLEFGQTSRDLVNIDRSSSRVSILATDLTAAEIRQLEERIYREAEKHPAFNRILVTGESIPISHLSPNNIFMMTLSILTTFFFTSMVLAAYFKNWRIAIVALASTIIPVVCGFGLWGLFSGSMGLATTVIVAVCMGVVIDDSIHMIYSHLDGQKRLNLASREASAYAMHRVGVAIVTTTLVLVVGFSVLLFSDFQLNSAFGGCSALILLCALAFDLRILPEMLVWASDNGPNN